MFELPGCRRVSAIQRSSVRAQALKRRPLGTSDMDVSIACLGTMVRTVYMVLISLLPYGNSTHARLAVARPGRTTSAIIANLHLQWQTQRPSLGIVCSIVRYTLMS
jgi:hypothetical protein